MDLVRTALEPAEEAVEVVSIETERAAASHPPAPKPPVGPPRAVLRFSATLDEGPQAFSGTVPMVFALYREAADAEPIFTEAQDVKVASGQVSVELGANGSLAWIRRFAIQDGPRGLPDSGDINAAPGHIALQNGLVALGEVPVKAGEVIGRVGWFNPDADGRGEKQEVIDFALFAAEPIFEVGDLTFDVVDEDDDEGILCNSRTVWKRFTTDPEVLARCIDG